MSTVIEEVRGLITVEDERPNNFDYDPNITVGKFITYKMNKSYSRGTKFRVYLKNNKSTYVYAIATDYTNKTVVLFPHKSDISPNLNYTNNEIVLPSKTSHIILDDVRGTDIFCLLYSKKKLDIKSICNHLEQHRGTFFQRLYKTLKNELVPKKYLRYYNEHLRFEIKSNVYGYIVPIVVKIPHD